MADTGCTEDYLITDEEWETFNGALDEINMLFLGQGMFYAVSLNTPEKAKRDLIKIEEKLGLLK